MLKARLHPAWLSENSRSSVVCADLPIYNFTSLRLSLGLAKRMLVKNVGKYNVEYLKYERMASYQHPTINNYLCVLYVRKYSQMKL